MNDYQAIANAYRQTLPDEFDQAWIEAVVYRGASDLKFFCEDKTGIFQPEMPASVGFDIHRALLSAVTTIRPLETDGEKRYCTFHLYQDGRFKLDLRDD